MPTIPIAKMIYVPANETISLQDMAGGITRMSAKDLHILAKTLTQAEWSALRFALMQPEVWFNVTGDTDSR